MPLALEWIKVLVDPFKQPVARSSKKCAELATTVQRVQRVCEVMLAGAILYMNHDMNELRP